MDHYMVVSYSRDDKFSPAKHKVIFGNLSKENIKRCKEETSNTFDSDLISAISEAFKHSKICRHHNCKYIFSTLDYMKGISFYFRKFDSPIYGLMIKTLDVGCEQIGVKTVEDYILMDYIYDLEELDKVCHRYESLPNRDKILIKVFTRTHPIDTSYALNYLTRY